MNREFGITHGSPHFLLFQKNLREAIKKWEESDDEYKQHPDQQGKREAIKFFKNQTGGEKYWENLKDNEGYRGFNWLQQHPDQQGKREAIKFFKNQTGGEKYRENLKDNEGYPGFNWLQQQNHKINHRRVAFVGVRDKEDKDVMHGKGLRSPLDTLFTE